MALGTILTLASLASSAFGNAKSAQANKRIDNKLNADRRELDYWYDKEYNKNYFDTDQAKSVIGTLKDNFRDTVDATKGKAAVTGASNEAVVGAMDSAQKNYSNALMRLAGYGTDYRDSLRREYVTRNTGLNNLELANMENKSKNWSNFIGNALNASQGFAEAGANGAFDKADVFLKNLFKKAG